MTKNLFAFCLFCLMTAAAVTPARSDQKPINLGTIGAVPPTSEEEKLCMRHVRMHLGGVVYEISRVKNMRYDTVDGKSVSISDPHHPYNDCAVVDAGEVKRFSTGFVKWTDFNIDAALAPAKPDSEISTYGQNKSIIDEAVAGGNVIRMPDDSRKLIFGKSAVYLLPKNVNVTKNGEAVAVYCTPNPENDVVDPKTDRKPEIKTTICKSQYWYPNGLVFGYTYLEREESDHVALDLAIRKKFASYIVKQ